MQKQIDYLRELAAAASEACLVHAGATVRIGSTALRNALGVDAYLPSGHAYQGYRALWLRDFVMSAPALTLPGDELITTARLFAASQRPEDWIWHNGHVPAWTPAEHINLDGGHCYYPGSYFPDERQGGRWGPYPPMDNAFFFIELVYLAFHANGDAVLHEKVDGISLLERACRAYDAVTYHPDTGLAWSPATKRAVDFGFCDCVHKIGQVQFGSCLAYRAAVCLAEMADAGGVDAMRWRNTAARIRKHLVPTFGTTSGFLNAATDVCRQRDVWGTAFAVYVGALDGDAQDAACRALRDAYRDGTAVREGAVRHVLAGDDWSKDSAWEYACAPIGTYQNGGYWLTASGWYLYALAQVDAAAAHDMLADMLAHLRATDFRNSPDHRGPHEWHTPGTGERGKAVNLTSICCPLQAMEQIVNTGI